MRRRTATASSIEKRLRAREASALVDLGERLAAPRVDWEAAARLLRAVAEEPELSRHPEALALEAPAERPGELDVGDGAEADAAESFAAIGQILYDRRRYDLARRACGRALKLAGKDGAAAPLAAARARHIRGMAALHDARPGDERLPLAYGDLLRARDILARLEAEGDAEARAYAPRVLTGLGQACRRKGDLVAARAFFQAALERRDPADLRGRAITLGSLGLVAYCLELHREALERYREDLEICERLGDRQGVSLAHGLLGGVHLAKGDAARALEEFRLALEKGPADLDRALARRGVAAALAESGRLDEAGAELERARRALERAGAEESLALCGVVEARLAHLRGDARAAEDLARAAAGRLRELNSHFQAAKAWELAADAACTRGDDGTRDAARALEHAIEAGQRIGSPRLLRRLFRRLRALDRDGALLLAFGRYLDRRLVREILAHGLPRDRRARTRTVTIIFADVRDYTSLAEALPAESLVALIDQYLAEMTRAVLENGGRIDKFLGDGVLAVFERRRGDDPALAPAAAVRAAWQMLERLALLNRRLVEQHGRPLSAGIGIHTGRVVAASLGPPEYRQLTVLGDSVNLASRVEGLTKHFGATILATRAVVRRVRDGERRGVLPPERHRFRHVARVRVKGKKKPVTLYDLVGIGRLSRDTEAAFALYRRGIRHFRAGRADLAYDAFQRLYRRFHAETEGRLHLFHLRRCIERLAAPPGEEFSDVVEFTTK